MSKITYPYEIESTEDNGLHWVYTANDEGELLVMDGGAFIEDAVPTCEQLVNAINGIGPEVAVLLWAGDSCRYHGPLREMPTAMKEVT